MSKPRHSLSYTSPASKTALMFSASATRFSVVARRCPDGLGGSVRMPLQSLEGTINMQISGVQ